MQHKILCIFSRQVHFLSSKSPFKDCSLHFGDIKSRSEVICSIVTIFSNFLQQLKLLLCSCHHSAQSGKRLLLFSILPSVNVSTDSFFKVPIKSLFSQDSYHSLRLSLCFQDYYNFLSFIINFIASRFKLCYIVFILHTSENPLQILLLELEIDQQDLSRYSDFAPSFLMCSQLPFLTD